MADTKNLLFLGAAGAAVWYFFFRTPTTAAPVQPTTTTTGTAPIVTAPATDATNTIAGIFAKMVTVATNAGIQTGQRLNIDQWGYFLNQVLNPLGFTAPDPMPIFASVITDRSSMLNATDYWAVMGPAVKQQTGLSGLGFFGGSGGLGRWVQ